ncbi:MAG: tetratricopeptide repeat protein [Deltaproteobacteria bacterium]|nr:tetratricopeptide repeat protein [Deltaproteobacteria bacterium]
MPSRTDVPDPLPSGAQVLLFSGPHVPETRCRDALDRLDIPAALADAPEAWHAPLAALGGALGSRGSGPHAVERLVACHGSGWPPEVERAWQRLVGRSLDHPSKPRSWDGDPAAAFLLRGGETDAARASLDQHLRVHPADASAWHVMARIVPLPAAARCAFHGGPVLPPLDDLVDLPEEDAVAPISRWMISYAFIADLVPRTVLEDALRAEDRFDAVPLAMPGDATAFAWYLVAEEKRRATPMPGGVGPMVARRALQQISAPTFRRYLGRLGGRF